MCFRDAEVINSSRVFLTLRMALVALEKFTKTKCGGGAFRPWYDHLKWMVSYVSPQILEETLGSLFGIKGIGAHSIDLWKGTLIFQFPVPYIFISKRDAGKPISQVITVDPWFQIYRELKDEGLLFSPSPKKRSPAELSHLHVVFHQVYDPIAYRMLQPNLVVYQSSGARVSVTWCFWMCWVLLWLEGSDLELEGEFFFNTCTKGGKRR